MLHTVGTFFIPFMNRTAHTAVPNLKTDHATCMAKSGNRCCAEYACLGSDEELEDDVI